MVPNETKPHADGARNERSTKNKCKNDAFYALHVSHFPIFFLFGFGALLDRAEPYDDLPNSHYEKENR